MSLLKEEKVVEYTKDGLTVRDVTIHEPPFFYRGNIPLVYRCGAFDMFSSRSVQWLEFKDFRIEYGTTGKKEIPGIGASIPATATVKLFNGTVIARAEVIELIKGGFIVEEEHLDETGDVVYSVKSFFDFQGEKQSEAEPQGKKEKEYFFLWPS